MCLEETLEKKSANKYELPTVANYSGGIEGEEEEKEEKNEENEEEKEKR